jgi:hypothetical protein
MVYEKLKNYWIEKIDSLKFAKSVPHVDLPENEGSTDNNF